jgi:hypothetical protein
MLVVIAGGLAARAAEPDEQGERKEAKAAAQVSIVFSAPRYRFTLEQAAKGIAIEYEVVVARDLAGILPLPQGSAGLGISAAEIEAGKEKAGVFIPFEALGGDGQRYGLYDVGLPPPRPVPPATIRKGRYRHTFAWDGRNWSGPSDTSTPKGAPFPAGTYTLEVSCIGLSVREDGQPRFHVANRVEVTLTE